MLCAPMRSSGKTNPSSVRTPLNRKFLHCVSQVVELSLRWAQTMRISASVDNMGDKMFDTQDFTRRECSESTRHFHRGFLFPGDVSEV
jgi:hypothetical protein